ncbi:MAG: hypothetical protein FWF75_08280, partial [Propionibacteriaceae bacterium]|nr:hypothetical protein [Propionibacteriaceae bacterium]
EAARLIDAQASSGGEPTPGAEPLVGEVLDAGVSDAGAPEGTEVLRRARADDDAAGLGRPQFATFLRDAVRRATAGPRPGVPQVSRIAVRAVGRRVRVVADPGVSTVNVTGPHLLRRSGDVIEVTSDGDIGPSLDGFSLVRPPHTLEDLRTMSLGKQLVVRVNPAVVVDAEVDRGQPADQRRARAGASAGFSRQHEVHRCRRHRRLPGADGVGNHRGLLRTGALARARRVGQRHGAPRSGLAGERARRGADGRRQLAR